MNTELLKLLLETYVELNKISASPGDKSHRLWKCIEFIERTIKQIIKDDKVNKC